jgi:hypothetical protein
MAPQLTAGEQLSSSWGLETEQGPLCSKDGVLRNCVLRICILWTFCPLEAAARLELLGPGIVGGLVLCLFA